MNTPNMGKKIGWLLLALFAVGRVYSQSYGVAVDERVELLSIAFYLGGNEEYSHIPEAYKKRIDAHFTRYADHKLIRRLVPAYRKYCNIGWNAPVSLALQLEISPKGKIAWIPNVQTANVDPRWQIVNSRKFFNKLNDFYRKAKFREFCRDSREFYDEAVARMETCLETTVDPSWFDAYFGFGAPKRFNIVLGLCTGYHNYGLKTTYHDNDRQDLYCVVGSWRTDDEGMPAYPPGYYDWLLVHEFSHSYCNPLMAPYIGELVKYAPAYRTMAEERGCPDKLGGGWENILYEALVRACTIRYFEQKGTYPAALVGWDRSQGVFFTKELSDWLVRYESNRDKYPTLESFMPEIMKFYDDYFAAYVAVQ